MPSYHNAADLQTLQPLHIQLALYKIANPASTLQEMANEFKLTPNWIWKVLNSDLCKAYISEKMEVQAEFIQDSVRQKLSGVTALALEKLEAEVVRTADPKFIKEVAKDLLEASGFGSKAAPPAPAHQQVNVFQMSREELAMHRAAITQGPTPPVLEASPQFLPAPSALPGE